MATSTDIGASGACDLELVRVLALLAIDTVTVPYCPRGERQGLGALGTFCRNLVLKDRRGQLFLVLADELQDRVDLKKLRKALNASRSLSFVCDSELNTALGQHPGAVSMFGLLSRPRGLRVVLDCKLLQDEQLLFNFHPFDECYATQIAWVDVQKFVRFCGYDVEVLDVPYV